MYLAGRRPDTPAVGLPHCPNRDIVLAHTETHTHACLIDVQSCKTEVHDHDDWREESYPSAEASAGAARCMMLLIPFAGLRDFATNYCH